MPKADSAVSISDCSSPATGMMRLTAGHLPGIPDDPGSEAPRNAQGRDQSRGEMQNERGRQYRRKQRGCRNDAHHAFHIPRLFV